MSRGAKIRFQKIDRLVSFTVVTVLVALTSGYITAAEEARPVCCAGSVYSADSRELFAQIDALIKSVPVNEDCGDVLALIVPDGPYLYVGSLLAKAYAIIANQKFERVIIVGFDPTADSPTLYTGSRLSTPLGQLPSDRDFAEKFTVFTSDDYSIAPADKPLPRSIEIQLPFIQYLYGERPIFAIGVADLTLDDALELGNIIAGLAKDNRALLIGVSNLSSGVDIASCEVADSRFLKRLCSMGIDRPVGDLGRGETRASSSAAILSIAEAAISAGANKAVILRYTNTGRITGNPDNVCGYVSAVFGISSETATEKTFTLSSEDSRYLLALARSVIAAELGLRETPPSKPPDFDDCVAPAGIYISFYIEDEYRGGVGSLFPVESISKVVRNVALTSAFNDPRYNPLTSGEFAEVTLRLYLLTGIRKINDINNFDPGFDGIIVRSGSYSAMMLPEDMDITLNSADILGRACLEAGLLSSCWCQPETEVWAFDVQEFEEER